MPNLEEQIRRAIEEGKFDDLPGKGKPIHLDQNPFEDPEWRLANHILQSSGFTLPWIEVRHEIEAMLVSARERLKGAQKRRIEAERDGLPRSMIRMDWNEALVKFREQIEEINRRIIIYNLDVPLVQFQIQQLSADRELELTSSLPSDTLPE